LIYIDGSQIFNGRKVPNELGALAAIGAQLAFQIRHLISLINFLSYFTNLSNIFAAVTRTVKRTSFFRPLCQSGDALYPVYSKPSPGNSTHSVRFFLLERRRS
jgi:hypothetical protein